MRLFYIVRTPASATTNRAVCTGSSPITGKPYWINPRSESACLPLMLRDESYAEWVRDLCEKKDETPEGSTYTYEVFACDMGAILSAAEVEGGVFVTDEPVRPASASATVRSGTEAHRIMEAPAIGTTPVRCGEPGRERELFVWDGEPKRMPNKGEYFLSGALPEAYEAKRNLSTPYFICVPV